MNESTRMGLTTRMSSLVPQSSAFAASGACALKRSTHSWLSINCPILFPLRTSEGITTAHDEHICGFPWSSD